jgi:hypothetical protein
MPDDTERYDPQFNRTSGKWFIVHHQRQGNVTRQEVLPEQYDSEDEAESAAARMVVRDL